MILVNASTSSLWTPADLGALAIADWWSENTDVGITPSLISTFYDCTGSGRVAHRTEPSYRASLAVSASMNGKLVAVTPADYGTYYISGPSFFNTSSARFMYFIVGRQLTTSTYQALWTVSGASPMSITDSAGQAGVQIAGYQSVGAATSPSGVFARVWEFDGAVGRMWSPAGQAGVNFVAQNSFVGNSVNPSHLFGGNYNTMCFRGNEFGRGILVDTVDSALRAKWFAWCADYYGVTT